MTARLRRYCSAVLSAGLLIVCPVGEEANNDMAHAEQQPHERASKDMPIEFRNGEADDWLVYFRSATISVCKLFVRDGRACSLPKAPRLQ